MADILIRGLDEEVVKRLKHKAELAGRSLQSETKLILERAAGRTLKESLEVAEHWRKRLKGPFTDSVELLREDRQR